jgi:NADH:ubiquinone oxidoreductase subunit 3 (subunit A)
MLEQYAFILILTVLAFVLPLVAVLLGFFLGPRRPDPIKNATYESGVETIGDTWVQFRAQYYLIGLIFLIFDVEVIFLFPIALAFQRASFTLFSVLATAVFVVILLLGLFLEWRKGALEWQ